MSSAVHLPGYDPTRTDDDPKMAYGRYVQAHGGQFTPDGVRAFVASDPRWELNPAADPNNPQFRVKQGELDKWKPGTSVWQTMNYQNAPGAAPAAQTSGSWWDANPFPSGDVGSLLGSSPLTPALALPPPGSIGSYL